MSCEVLTVAQVTRQLKDCVEGNFPLVAVRGEASSCTQARSGHVYFTLKDDQAQLRVVIWRGVASRLRFEMSDGMELVVIGPLEVYPARGTYQLVAEEVIPQGIGPLELAFRQLHEKLAAEGLFDPQRKRSLPRFPRRIAIVTSPTGAAIRDLLQVLTRRWPCADVLLLPVAVQGQQAAPQIARALQTAGRLPGVDVIVTGRGGGSLEDLWAFNEEVVARALAASPVPTVSAVGHEIDVTIADLVADRRALTPSEAGEIVVPDEVELRSGLQHLERRLAGSLRERARAARRHLDLLTARRAFAKPCDRIHHQQVLLDEWQDRLVRGMGRHYRREQDRVGTLAAGLHALSPLNVLSRGYSITRIVASGEVVRRAEDVRPGDLLATTLALGEVRSRVEEVPSTNTQE